MRNSKSWRKSRPDYPGGVIGVYDNKNKTADRFTIVMEPFNFEGRFYFPTLHTSEAPGRPYSVTSYTEYDYRPTRVKGEVVINWKELPQQVQDYVNKSLTGK